MAFDLGKIGKDASITTRCFWDEKTKEEWVDFRLPNKFQLDKIRKDSGYVLKKTRERFETVDKNGKEKVEYQTFTEFDETEETIQSLTNNRIDFCIASWRLIDSNKNEIPCTTENKLLLYLHEDSFSKWVDKNLKALEDENDTDKGKELKN